MPPIVIIAILAAFLYTAAVVVFLLRGRSSKDVQRIQRRLTAVGETGSKAETDLDIVKKHQMSSLPWLNQVLTRQTWSLKLDRLLTQADIQAPLGVFMLLSLVLAAVGFLFGMLISRNSLAALAGGLVMSILPFWWIRLKKKRRMARFEEQLPEALDLVGRALKAGHTFSSGMNMVGAEFEDPIKGEFSKTLEEINFGVNIMEALDNLMDRVDCPDLNFFVVSVKIQSETGGNLAEIVENIASLIRERFKLKGRVRVLSAEGRFAAIILVLLPIGVGVVINLVNPDYMNVLYTTQPGKMILYGVIGLMTLGIAVIRRMIQIRV